MRSRQKNLTSVIIVINRLFPERYFSQSWAFDCLQPLTLYRYVLTTGMDFHDRRSGNNRFITILTDVRYFGGKELEQSYYVFINK